MYIYGWYRLIYTRSQPFGQVRALLPPPPLLHSFPLTLCCPLLKALFTQ